MEYIEPDGSSFGHNIDSTQMGLELYRLTAMFLSVGPIEEISSKARQSGKALVDRETHWLEALKSRFSGTRCLASLSIWQFRADST